VTIPPVTHFPTGGDVQDNWEDQHNRVVMELTASIRQLLPAMLQPAWDRYLDFTTITSVSVDRFIEMMESFRYQPPASVMELIRRLSHAMREVPPINVDHDDGDLNLPTYEENEANSRVRPRLSTGHRRMRPVPELEAGYRDIYRPSIDYVPNEQEMDAIESAERDYPWHDDL